VGRETFAIQRKSLFGAEEVQGYSIVFKLQYDNGTVSNRKASDGEALRIHAAGPSSLQIDQPTQTTTLESYSGLIWVG
jgi:hypothetical protein